MSTSRTVNSDKLDNVGATIGFRFHANDEELEEVSEKDNIEVKTGDESVKPVTDFPLEFFEGAKVIGDNGGTLSESPKGQRNLLGKRSISVDSACESPFSNPIETWKKLNVLKEKLTKTVEEKIFDRNVLIKSGRSKLNHSKENSSISDSEDTSESSKMSDQLRNPENQNENPNENAETHLISSEINPQDVKTDKSETETKESKSALRNRKNFANFSDLYNVPDIKIATAKIDPEGSLLDESLTDVESGVEADENLEARDDSTNFDVSLLSSVEVGGANPPFRGNNIFHYPLGFIKSVITSQTNTIAFLLGFTLYLFFPLSEFFRGFLLSFLLIIFWGAVKSYVQLDDSSQQQKPFIAPNYKSMPPLKVPQSKRAKGVWFNEYEREVYDPDYYSVTETVPAYLELEDNILKVSRPKGKIRRRATYDEPEYKLPIISQRIFNISGCNVFLMPDGLTRKRLYSKKYPIVIFLRPDSLISEKKNGKEMDEKGTHEDAETDEQSSVVNPESLKNKATLYLFARCDRQKEEWYRRLLAGARYCQKSEIETAEDTDNEAEKMPLDDSPNKEPCTPFETLFFDDEVAQIEEYFRYMTNFVHVEPINIAASHSRGRRDSKKKDAPVEKETESRLKKNIFSHYASKKSKSNQNSSGVEENENDFFKTTDQVQWFNAFVNRILFDVFRSPYWHSKIQEKIHRKLNSIRLPYYIEDIEVIEMDLGKTGPVFHRVSEPCIDERGLWFDMDVTFDGLIRLTIQTHLNLIKLQKGIEENEEIRTPEKPKKGKKNERFEKKSKDSFLTKDSNEASKSSTSKRNKKAVKTAVDGSLLEEPPLTELIEELGQIAEIAIEEGISRPKKEEDLNIHADDNPRSEHSKDRSPIYDSELEDSAESSDEDEEEDNPPPPQPLPVAEDQQPPPYPRRYPKTRRSSKRIFKVFENVAQSKYFRSVANSKYIQKAIAGVSAARLRLTLEIKSCTGILSINIPPPPSDRFWYGFREMPKLVFSANPKIGEKALRFVHIRNYLQKKILHELKKVMVTPNMIDFVLPTSAPARSSSSLQIEEPDLQETTLSE